MTSTQLAFQNNKINNTHSFYSPSLEEYIQVNDDVFNDIRDEEIELRALELLSIFLDKFFWCFKETIKPEFLIQKYHFKIEISNFIIYKQTLAFLFLLDYNRLV